MNATTPGAEHAIPSFCIVDRRPRTLVVTLPREKRTGDTYGWQRVVNALDAAHVPQDDARVGMLKLGRKGETVWTLPIIADHHEAALRAIRVAVKPTRVTVVGP